MHTILAHGNIFSHGLCQAVRERGSKRNQKAKKRLARVHRKVANQRKDFLHKTTTKLVQKYEGFCIEDLCVKGLARTKLAKSIMDAAFGEFRRQLEYKSIWYRRHFSVIDRWFPSSKLCMKCGTINKDLKLSDREWVCSCGEVHDRDLNAARNIRVEGLKNICLGPTAAPVGLGRVVAGYAETLNARGDGVKPESNLVAVNEPRIQLL
jgi:putative transposase